MSKAMEVIDAGQHHYTAGAAAVAVQLPGYPLTEDIGTATGPTTGHAVGEVGNPHLVWLLAGPLCLLAGLGSARASRPPKSSRGCRGLP